MIARLFALIAVLAAALCAGIDIFITQFFEEMRACPDRARQESLAWITYPPSARNIQAYCDGFTDYRAFVRFEMAPTDLNTFMASTQIKTPLSSTEIPHDFTAPNRLNDFGLDVMKIKSFLAATNGEGAVFPYQRILIDTSNPNLYVVYVFTFTT